MGSGEGPFPGLSQHWQGESCCCSWGSGSLKEELHSPVKVVSDSAKCCVCL